MGGGARCLHLFTISSDLPFLDALVAGLMDETGGDPLTLARYTILLPTRRAARALGEAFLRRSEGKALLLPRLVPVGDVDAEELALLGEEAAGLGGVEVPPAVPELQRQLLLTRLVLAWGRARGSGPLTPGQAAPLARALARFLDEVETEGGDFSRLADLVPADHAQHWQQVLDFLAILTEHWPRHLAEIGALDPAERRNAVLAAQAAAWRRAPPAERVIAAGLTGGVAAVADLLAVVVRLPRGAVVLPGLDRTLAGDSRDLVADDPAHPQHVMMRLLERLEIEPAQVRDWPCPLAPARNREARRRLVAETLCPAGESDRWRAVAGIEAASLDGLMRLDCAGPQEEATVIALLLRHALEQSERTAALVTPDRGLARRVAAELRRWDIDIDDSAGQPLDKAPPGVFLRLLLDLAVEQLAPLPLLAALKHPMAAGGQAPEAFRALVRRLEIATLRGPRPAPGFAGLAGVLPRDGALRGFVASLEAALARFLALMGAGEQDAAALVDAHIAAAEALAASDEESGADRLWRGEAGEAAADFLAEFRRHAAILPALDGHDYRALFETLISGPVVRPRYGRHPRLAIWGLLEARLQQADLLVLGGLNEGIWPPAVESDPWLSRPMRRSFGLPAPERRVGAAAHDFAQALGAAEVVMTRALRVEGAPTVPSRWLLRLDTVLRAAGLDGRLTRETALLGWPKRLDEAPRLTPRPPEPRPPLAARPRQLSVTQIETWMRDPYAIFARKILRLETLDPLDADPGAAERGVAIHEALDRFLRDFPEVLPEDAEARLLAHGEAAFGSALKRPGLRAFWWPRFVRIARWFIAEERERRLRLALLRSELSGRMTLVAPAGEFILTAKADRIDRARDGGIVLVDYKTGGVPSADEVALGFAPQLPLEAAIAGVGGFDGVPAAAVTSLEYWRLSGGDPPGEICRIAKDGDDLCRIVEDAMKGLSELIASFDDPATPYRAQPRPERAPRYSDYVHLARVMEWSVVGEGSE
ncbi:MAG TPA: double-strand break repair protein AddB [Stellaceae bacterium]|nr:double-strand break repair protein AddB [Stellaceae bacterium]